MGFSIYNICGLCLHVIVHCKDQDSGRRINNSFINGMIFMEEAWVNLFDSFAIIFINLLELFSDVPYVHENMRSRIRMHNI